MDNFDYIERNYRELQDEVSELSSRLGTKAPTIVAVTKSGSDEELLSLVRAGAHDIGENRPGELLRRSEIISAAGLHARMHEIGTLQRNKVKLIAGCAHIVHSVDTMRLANDLNKHAEALSRKMPVLIEINSAREEQKSGVLPELAEELAESIGKLPALKLSGLMTMGPVTESPEELRPYFRATRELFERLTPYFPDESPILSMGMSDSYRVAIEEGSTLIRVGRRLFRK